MCVEDIYDRECLFNYACLPIHAKRSSGHELSSTSSAPPHLCSSHPPLLSFPPSFISPSSLPLLPPLPSLTCSYIVLMDDTCTVHVHICLIDFTAYQDNTTPLYVACDKGHQEIVQILLAAGADVKIARSTVRA